MEDVSSEPAMILRRKATFPAPIWATDMSVGVAHSGRVIELNLAAAAENTLFAFIPTIYGSL